MQPREPHKCCAANTHAAMPTESSNKSAGISLVDHSRCLCHAFSQILDATKMTLQLRNFWWLWERSLTFTLSLLGLRGYRISFGLWFRLIRDELVETHKKPDVGHRIATTWNDNEKLIQGSECWTLGHTLYFLGPDNLRILVLEPGTWADPLSATLEVARLYDNTTKYEALSYAWGSPDPTPNKQIQIHNSTLTIRDNLDKALRSLRSEHSQTRIWVDYICINQSDGYERNHQVRMMGDIYRRAQKVVVWLGMPTSASKLGMEVLSVLAGDVDLTKGCLWETHAPVNLAMAIDDIMSRPYFKRIWVVQEGALARKIDLRVGNLLVAWEQSATAIFLSRLQFVQISPSWQYSGLFNGNLQPLIEMLTISRLAIAVESRTPVKPTIIVVLHDMRHRNSSDPRDMIFALLGLGLPTYGAMADYEISREETYRKLFEGMSKAAQQEMEDLQQGIYRDISRDLVTR